MLGIALLALVLLKVKGRLLKRWFIWHCAPKSNAVYTAWKQAQMDAINSPDYDVPNHLRNAPTSLMKDMGYGARLSLCS